MEIFALIGGGTAGRGALYTPDGRQIGWAAINIGSVGLQAGVQGFRMLMVLEDETALQHFKANLLTGSVEFDYKLFENWSVAAFFDSGSAYDNEPDFFSSVGLGVRFHSPLGAIKLDVAHPLDDPQNSWRIHVSLGPDI